MYTAGAKSVCGILLLTRNYIIETRKGPFPILHFHFIDYSD